MPNKRPPRFRYRPPPLTIRTILAWSDEEYRQTGRWPKTKGGPIRANRNESWLNIAAALRIGLRGLPGSSSLPQMLAQERGVPNLGDLPRVTESQIAAWG